MRLVLGVAFDMSMLVGVGDLQPVAEVAPGQVSGEVRRWGS